HSPAAPPRVTPPHPRGAAPQRPAHRGSSDRPVNRDRQGERPGFRSGASHDRPYGRRDEHRGGGSFGRREDKPRWKRNG
ncbi:hypothetical protein, partial [Streptomyces hirsutus]|uniref:hypothetical protein n=1 Tax=Streptomyces hirsutus TaxID=35620 RepID=UPI00365B6418